ncbi:hypothetical protein Scep_027046 [Stephania cephalantha]|uniref:Uncharacterized protein n=1 Tax=Stephania cephalantha TaxID=152367 RepID=A0AAP0HSJ5_9MAGN
MMQVVASSGISSGEGLVPRLVEPYKRFHPFQDSKFLSPLQFLRCPSCTTKVGLKLEKGQTRGFIVRASGNLYENPSPVAPLQFESPTGQLLAQILQTHPHLLPAAVDQQLENLHTDRDKQENEAPPPSEDLLLYRRIAEVREKDRQKALEEIIYCLIVQKFLDKTISMIPAMAESLDMARRVDWWPNQEHKLESIHSAEALEMVESHISLVLGEQLGPLDTVVEISKLKLGKLYAASIMYGYFLRRVDQRFQLERTMNMLPNESNEDSVTYKEPSSERQLWDPDSLIQMKPEDYSMGDQVFSKAEGVKSYRLRSYVMYLDAETLQRYATIRSREAVSLIEKQTQALFGRPDIRIAEDGSIDTSNDEIVGITFSGLTMLVLEAIAFGSFLWDAEGYVETKYHFLKS